MLAEWKDTPLAFNISEPEPELLSESILQGSSSDDSGSLEYAQVFTGRAQVFEDNVDTDAIIPAEFMPGMVYICHLILLPLVVHEPRILSCECQ